MAFGPVQQVIPWVACAAASAASIGLMVFGLRGDPVDFGKYLGAPPLPPSVQHPAPDDRPLAMSEGSGRTAPEAPASVASEAPDHAQPPEQPAQQPMSAQVAPEPAKAEPVKAEPVTAEPARPETVVEAEPAALPADTGALALLNPEPPRAAAPAPKARPPRVRSSRRPAHLSAVQRRPRAAPRWMRGPRMQTITIFHGPTVEVVRVPR